MQSKAVKTAAGTMRMIPEESVKRSAQMDGRTRRERRAAVQMLNDG